MVACEIPDKNPAEWSTIKFWDDLNRISPQPDFHDKEARRVTAKVMPFLRESGICSALWQHFLDDPTTDPFSLHPEAAIKRITASTEIGPSGFGDTITLEYTNKVDGDDVLLSYPMDLTIWTVPSSGIRSEQIEIIKKIQEKLHAKAKEYYL